MAIYIVNWRAFWELFSISIHHRSKLSGAEKLYSIPLTCLEGWLRYIDVSLKDSGSGENYNEAIKCLQNRYDRPRLIHQPGTRIRAILDAPALKDGSGKDLRRLHDTVSQHLRALKAMDCKPT